MGEFKSLSFEIWNLFEIYHLLFVAFKMFIESKVAAMKLQGLNP